MALLTEVLIVYRTSYEIDLTPLYEFWVLEVIS